MSVAIRRVQVDDEGHAVGVDIALVRSPGAPHLVHADGIPPDVRTALQAWLLPEGGAIVNEPGSASFPITVVAVQDGRVTLSVGGGMPHVLVAGESLEVRR